MTDLHDVHTGHKEGWAKLVAAPPRVQPERLTARKFAALSSVQKARYNRRRRDWHANMGVLRTPQLRALHEALWDIADSNVHDNDRAKGAVAIEGAAGVGKSTAVEQFAKEFHLREVAESGTMTADGNERWPVCRVTLSGHPTLRDLNVSLLQFFAHPGISRGSAADFARRALDVFLACEVRLLIIDDLHFLQWQASDGAKVSNHLKFIANEFPVTLVLVGVDLTDSGLFTEGRAGREAALAQTARRTTRLTMERFAHTAAGRKQWRSVLHAIETRVVLVKHHDGTVSEQLADYLYARTSGHIGSLMTLINRASSRAIRTGTEALTEQLLDATPIDAAAESARAVTAATLHTARHPPRAPRRLTIVTD